MLTIKSKRIPVIDELMTPEELAKFMKKHGFSAKELSELLGLSIQAVMLWQSGERPIKHTNTRLIRLFDKYPALLKEF